MHKIKYRSNTIYIILICLYSTLSNSCTRSVEKKTVYAIPVYGQSLALGEEAIRVTDFDSLSITYNYRIVTQNLDDKFGYFSDSRFKQWIKSIINDRHRAFELSIYGMSETIIKKWDTKATNDHFVICTFPGGRGATGIMELGKGSKPYDKFLKEIKNAYQEAQKRGWDFYIPAICWMQGENDIVWQEVDNYKKRLKKIQTDLNADIKNITKQNLNVKFICYQTNCLTASKHFDPKALRCDELNIPQAQMELIRDDSLFAASGPTYPYSFVDERVHIDGVSQKRLGYLAGLSFLRLLDSKQSKGLIPIHSEIQKNTVILSFNVPYPPLVIDTILVTKAKNYGFNVIDTTQTDILEYAVLVHDKVILHCNTSPTGCIVRYAVNGINGKSGNKSGPRGNLRDSQGMIETAIIQGNKYPLHNWCFQFELKQ